MSNKYKTGNRRGRPPKYQSVEELNAKVEDYFASLHDEPDEEDRIPTLTGLTLFLGFKSKQSLYDYEARSGELGYVIRRALSVIENNYEKKLLGQYSSGPIFALKNFGWTDKQEIHYTGEGESDEVDLSKLSDEELHTWKTLIDKASTNTNGNGKVEADAEPA